MHSCHLAYHTSMDKDHNAMETVSALICGQHFQMELGYLDDHFPRIILTTRHHLLELLGDIFQAGWRIC